jgi:hypothetical protein
MTSELVLSPDKTQIVKSVGRNKRCGCGEVKIYKKCCMGKDLAIKKEFIEKLIPKLEEKHQKSLGNKILKL